MADNQHRAYGAIVVSAIGTVLIFLYLLRARLGYSEQYAEIYIGMGLVSFILAALFWIVDWTKADGADSIYERALFISEEDEEKPFSTSTPLIMIAVAALMGVFVAGVVWTQKFAFYAVPNALGSTLSHTTQSLSQASASTFFLSSIVPGLFEEFLIFSLIGMLRLMGMSVTEALTGKSDSTGVGAFWTVTSCGVGAGFFSWAHGTFIGNQAAYAWAFVFEWVVQMMNHFGGVFVSPLVHIPHNAAVVATQTLSIAPFATTILAGGLIYSPAIIHYVRKWRRRSHEAH